MSSKRATCLFAIMAFLVLGCGQEELVDSFEIYSNNFDSGNLSNIEGGQTFEFNNETVIGNYNNGGFRLELNDISPHDFLVVSFDLYIHDTWDGNTNGFDPDQPDLWVMEFNKDITLNRTSNPQFATTFSNTPCDFQLCLWQSYPEIFPFISGPQRGRVGTAPGLCVWADRSNGTSVYKIQKTYRHDASSVIIDFYDKLYQPNVPSGLCDESWSMDNLVIRGIITD